MNPTTILVVEDQKIISLGIEKQLRIMGYALAGTATTGEEAVRKAIELRPDLILMDITLGDGIDGVEAATRIHEQINVPVVYLTANSDHATLQRAKLTDPFGYVLKPFEEKDLQTAIEIGLYRHKMQQRLRENEQWLAATLGSIGDGLIATDERCRVRFMNSLAEQLTGWTLADALDRDLSEIFHIIGRRNRELVRNPVLDALEKGETSELAPDTLLIDKTGRERPIDDSAAPIRDVSGKVSGAVLVFRDITERRRLEDHVRQAQKMEAISRLAGGIAHDFNNIMTVITGFSELLLVEDLPPADRLDYSRHIHDAGKRAAALTQQIMAFSRKQMLVPSVLNLNTIVRDMGAMVRRLLGTNIELAVEMAADLGEVTADPTQIGQVILNLTANARDAMPNGGRLELVTANIELDETTTRLHPDLKPGMYAMLSVSDNGCGMSDEVMGRIFEPFFTTKGVGEGTGLGLATVYGIVRQSGGHIDVTSKLATGTKFRVCLPLIPKPAPPEIKPEIRPPVKSHETILLVEDEEMVRRMTTMILRRVGYDVLEATNGLEAVALAEKHGKQIRLLITDLMMPQLSGREVADRLTALIPELRVLYVSGHTDDILMQQGIEKAAVDFLQKPFNINALKFKVREILDRPE
ncbi:ATP-binding response regulator [Zavarzinella formosa]|uniref:ATP-binding response regulator n=1 Tax=Zavarzinella formosa TaxID=360055 RepID=UPI00031AC4E6|nr:hybrid sensor histidine kinase/response regulator [Zavarzinella formosa]